MKSPEELEFEKLMKDDAGCETLAQSICSSEGFSFHGNRIFEGSRILYDTGDNRVLKIFSKDESSFCLNEAEHLKLLHGRLTVHTPELAAAGTLQEYPFLIMEKMEGVPLKSLWKNMSSWERKQILSQTASMLRELHSIPTEEMEHRETNWNTFIKKQADNIRKNHMDFGLSSKWTNLISAFIKETDPIEFSSEQVICHTEVMQDHLFVTETAGRFSISGLIDFEPSMNAVPEYDFCSVGLFISGGRKGLFKHFLDSYGYKKDSTGIMRMLLLHRYSNMKWFLSTIPDDINIATIQDLINFWY